MGAVTACGFDFRQGRPFGDADRCLYTLLAGGESHTLRVIAGRTGNHTARFFLVRQGGDLIVGAAQLESAGFLQAICLEIEPAIGNKAFGRNHGR